MSVWWVNLGERFSAQLAASALWCPDRTIRGDGSLGPPAWHWQIIEDVQPGEFVVMVRDGYIEGLALCRSRALVDQAPPLGFPAIGRWHERGWLLPVAIVLLKTRRKRAELTDGLFRRVVRYGPLTRSGEGAQIYLTKLRDLDGDELYKRIEAILNLEQPGRLELALGSEPADEKNDPNAPSVPTTRAAVVQARVGQGQFRKDLLTFWSAKCCATGLDIEDLLIASHIHPWSTSNDHERVDKFNGLLLSPSYDRAFDKGLISLDNDGKWVNVSGLSNAQLSRAGLGDMANQPVIGLTTNHHTYLVRHRERSQDRAKNGTPVAPL